MSEVLIPPSPSPPTRGRTLLINKHLRPDLAFASSRFLLGLIGLTRFACAFVSKSARDGLGAHLRHVLSVADVKRAVRMEGAQALNTVRGVSLDRKYHHSV